MTNNEGTRSIILRNTIDDAFRRAAKKYRGREALLFGDRIWSFHDLDRAAGRVARRLAGLGFSKGDRVVAYGRNSDAYLVAWLGCVRAGLVHVPANYALTAGELRYVLEQSDARGLLFDVALSDTAAAAVERTRVDIAGTFHGGGSRHAVDILATMRDESAPADFDAAASDEDLAQILYTSGTTAAPKGAMMTHRALLHEYESCIIDLEFAGDDRSLAALPLYHSAQMHVFAMPHLMMGVRTILLDAPVPEVCLRLIEEQRITSFFAPPTVWISLLRNPGFDRHDLRSLKKLYYGASIMPVPVLEELRRRLPGIRAYNCYGQSEIGPLATVLRPEEHDARPASAGRPVINVATRVVDEHMNDVPPRTNGEIVHRSPQLLTGYWNKPEETEQAFSGGWFHSGDVGFLDEEGYLFVVDRVKDVINSGGIVLASREVEEALFTHPAVSEVAVIGLPDPKWIEAVVAVVVVKAGHAVSAEALIAHARERLAAFKTPKRVIFVETLPRNTAGKLLKRDLRTTFAKADTSSASKAE